MSDFKQLLVWQKAQAMALDAHRVASRIRGRDNWRLRSQIIGAAQSVPATIVEGTGQQSSREFMRYLRISLNSTTELEHHLLTARELRVVRDADSLSLLSQVIEVRKMLYGLLRYLKTRPKNDKKGQ